MVGSIRILTRIGTANLQGDPGTAELQDRRSVSVHFARCVSANMYRPGRHVRIEARTVRLAHTGNKRAGALRSGCDVGKEAWLESKQE